MKSEDILSKLDRLIGEFDTPYFNYLAYSYDLTLEECEEIFDKIRNDIRKGNVETDNMVHLIDSYFKDKTTDLEKTAKIDYLAGLLSQDNDFFERFLERYGLGDDEIGRIYDKVKDKILEDNIEEFEIRRYLNYYFSNSVKQSSYISELNFIVGNNYDTLLIKGVIKKYPILKSNDIYMIASHIHSDILDAVEFKNGIKDEFKKRAMKRSEAKKAQARSRLMKFVDDSGDSFDKFIKSKGLSRSEGDYVVGEILSDISEGLIQPDEVDGVFITRRFNEYCDYENQ